MEATKFAVRPFEGRYEMHQAMTTEAVRQFDDGYFDFIYVDATHSYMDSKADVESWWPKLRVGGLMAGDDYFNGYVDAAGQVGRTSISSVRSAIPSPPPQSSTSIAHDPTRTPPTGLSPNEPDLRSEGCGR